MLICSLLCLCEHLLIFMVSAFMPKISKENFAEKYFRLKKKIYVFVLQHCPIFIVDTLAMYMALFYMSYFFSFSEEERAKEDTRPRRAALDQLQST